MPGSTSEASARLALPAPMVSTPVISSCRRVNCVRQFMGSLEFVIGVSPFDFRLRSISQDLVVPQALFVLIMNRSGSPGGLLLVCGPTRRLSSLLSGPKGLGKGTVGLIGPAAVVSDNPVYQLAHV